MRRTKELTYFPPWDNTPIGHLGYATAMNNDDVLGLFAGGSTSSVVCRPVAVTQGVPRPIVDHSPSPSSSDSDKPQTSASDVRTTHVAVRPDEDGDMLVAYCIYRVFLLYVLFTFLSHNHNHNRRLYSTAYNTGHASVLNTIQ